MKQNKNSEQNEKISLEHHLNLVKQDDYSGTFPEMENWLYKADIQMKNYKQLNERKLQKMKNFLFAHRLRLVYTIVILAVIIGACNMPVTQTESAGKIITMVVPSDNTDFQVKMNDLPWMKNAQVSSNENTDNGVKQTLYRIILPNTTEEQAQNYCKDLEAIGGISTIKISGMDYDVKRPLYSAALHNFFSIDINASGMSDTELQNEMQRQLKEQGVDMKFNVKTNADGRREISIDKDNMQPGKEPESFELNVEDNNGKEKIKMMTKKADPEKFKGKTDREIREMVKKDFNNPDLKDSDILIDRTGKEVQVQVKINMNKKEIK